MNTQTAASISPHRTQQLVVTIAAAVLWSLASFQSAWAQTAPSLGTAKSFAVLGGSTVTNTGPSTIHGDLGVSPGSAVTGFPPGLVIAPGTIHGADAVALQAENDVTTAYNILAGQPSTSDKTGQDLGGQTLVAGVYTFTSSAQLTGTVTLDAQGTADAVFIFQIGSTLTTASNSNVRVINGAQPCNVFWQVGSSATLGTNTSFIGNILALTSITVTTGTSVNGRALARNGAVTLDNNNFFFATCSTGPDSGPIPPAVPPTPGTCGGPNQPSCTVDIPPPGGGLCTDVTPPIFSTPTVSAGTGGHTVVTVKVRDTGSGLVSVTSIAGVTSNATVVVTPFTVNTTGFVTATATKTIVGSGSVVGLKATDFCGNATLFDPVDFTITAGETVTVSGIARVEHLMTIINDGLEALDVTVNGNQLGSIRLRPHATKTFNIGRATLRGDGNVISVEAFGTGGGSAVIMVHPK